MSKKPKKFETYEDVATHLLYEFADEFGLEKVEGKQKILGLKNDTKWEIDAKGIAEEGKKFVIIECRRYTKSRLKQASIGALAYCIDDTGASGGIIVSPLGLQEGAEKVANANGIVSVTLDADSTSTDYVMKFLDQIKAGLSGKLTFTKTLGIRVIRKDDSVEDLGCV